MWRDGERVELKDQSWLQVEAPAGQHDYEFRYLPWDVPLGILLTLVGIGLCGWMWFRGADTARRTSSYEETSSIQA